ncbi:MAG: tRNA (guanosine(37)-N1)-methyltransferase TrmD [Clostridiales Family XIII bacterium]|jgi:tRNA (guanine37-N1)-methyltransferase|nr:tRNA (guanosine(37)-N1)-methyltransferase TrmD [Clostridiales Family XIII bacterium]
MNLTVNVLTLFPEMFGEVIESSILGRAGQRGILDVRVVNIRDYSTNKHLKTDDYPFGGGAGMVMMAQPVFDALSAMGVHGQSYSGDESGPHDRRRMIYMSPRGRLLDGKLATELAAEKEIVILCGHYEGMDQRVLYHFHFEEVSIGDYILTGGELPAMVLIDTVARLLPEALGNQEAHAEESIYSGLLEYPQYTRPASFAFGTTTLDVPGVLISGNHKEIRLWNFRQSLDLTMHIRPDLFRAFAENPPENLLKEERIILDEYCEVFLKSQKHGAL